MNLKSSDAQNRFGVLLDTAQREPVTIMKHGRPIAVLLSKQEYERLQTIEDAYWGAQALAAEREGSLGGEESEKLLKKLLTAEDEA